MGTNICYYCKKAIGNCSWSAYDPKTKKLLCEPVAGWTATPAIQKNGNKIMPTYHITACPEFDPDDDYKRNCRSCGATLTIDTGRTSYCEKCAPSDENYQNVANALYQRLQRRKACDDWRKTRV